MEQFAKEARLLQKKGAPTSEQLKSLVMRHRFLRSVCSCHQASEDEVLFPAVRQLLRHQQELLSGCSVCEQEHSSEGGIFENLGRLLNDARASARSEDSYYFILSWLFYKYRNNCPCRLFNQVQWHIFFMMYVLRSNNLMRIYVVTASALRTACTAIPYCPLGLAQELWKGEIIELGWLGKIVPLEASFIVFWTGEA